MTGKMKLYIGLLVLGLALVGGSLWFLFNSPKVINVPEGEPIIAMESLYTMAGVRTKLFIYEGGTIICTQDEGLRPGGSRTRTWKKGRINEQELDELILLIRGTPFAELEEGYYWLERRQSDLNLTISVNYQNILKTVVASGYLSPDGGLTYPDMPYPLNEIYKKLRDIGVNKTEEVYRESI